MSDRNDRCEHCKFYEPKDGKTGNCRNPDLHREEGAYKPAKDWPNVRPMLVCGFFVPRKAGQIS
ncbi:MAG: hypothetical protein ACYTAO_02365 [Planctomycetota bacterium]